MTRAEAEKLVWDFAGLNREVESLRAWGKRPSRALSAKIESMAAQLINALAGESETNLSARCGK
jgi:hypothetical protein